MKKAAMTRAIMKILVGKRDENSGSSAGPGKALCLGLSRRCAAARGRDEVDRNHIDQRVEGDAAEYFVDAEADLEQANDRPPKHAAQRRQRDQEQVEQGRGALVQQDILGAPTGEERAHHHLALDADIPQARAKGDDQADADQGERYPEVDDAADFARVFECAFPEGVYDFQRVAPDGDDDRRANRQRNGDGQEEECQANGKRARGGHGARSLSISRRMSSTGAFYAVGRLPCARHCYDLCEVFTIRVYYSVVVAIVLRATLQTIV